MRRSLQSAVVGVDCFVTCPLLPFCPKSFARESLLPQLQGDVPLLGGPLKAGERLLAFGGLLDGSIHQILPRRLQLQLLDPQPQLDRPVADSQIEFRVVDLGWAWTVSVAKSFAMTGPVRGTSPLRQENGPKKSVR